MHAIQDLMNYWEHCHECGGLMVTVPGGSVCPHCNFELEDPEEGIILSLFGNPNSEKDKPKSRSVAIG